MAATWLGPYVAFLTNAISSMTRLTTNAVRAGAHVHSIRMLYSGFGNFCMPGVAVML